MLANAGFRVYGPRQTTPYVTGGAQPGLKPNVAGNLISTVAGEYTAQVYNYNPGVAIDDVLTLPGAA